MRFQHHDEIWRDFPGLVPGVILAEGIFPAADVRMPAARFTALLVLVPTAAIATGMRTWQRRVIIA